MRIKCFFILYFIGLFFAVLPLQAQKVSVSTNLYHWATLGTINLEGSISVAQHLSVHVGGRFNPWTMTASKSGIPYYLHQKTSYAGIRYWPWYIHSGWWLGGKLQYMDYAETGIWRPAIETGRAIGLGLAGGYSLMLNKHWNLDFGIGGWGGYMPSHSLYGSERNPYIREEGPKVFVWPDEMIIAFSYVF